MYEVNQVYIFVFVQLKMAPLERLSEAKRRNHEHGLSSRPTIPTLSGNADASSQLEVAFAEI
jgi:hypothetical protein